MNRIYRCVWSQAPGAFVAAAETTRSKGPRGSARTTLVAAAGAMLLTMAAPIQARADTAIGPVKVDNAGGAVCTSPDRPATASSAWTCQVPNGSGGFATITGVPGAASGYPDVAALSTLLSTNLGANAILMGSTTTSASGNSSIAIGNSAVASGAGSIALGAGAVATSSNGVAIGSGTTADRAGMNGQKELFSNVAVLSTQGGVSVGAVGSERQITNVAGGTQATDAVNVRQLQAVQQSAVRYDTNVDGTVNHNSVTMGNGSSTGPVTVHNVAPGVASTDAVNVQQLNQASAASAAYADARVNQMGKTINDIGRKAYAGVAAAMAMESAPYVAGKLTYAAGMGYYEQQAAMGVSLRKTADNGRWSVTGGASATSRGTVALRVGIGGVWD
ncbi:ESPR-type extended signal peptide-containing protein [uncultured Variovorax sp.]|uniref:ESPR-type extended signal peptide-containing protein n=1 Tax=uncultured Variovorax sp. TaxID=114708 RepID=UPI0025EEDD63|nr:ESPR-type extended signal peptide-containing protein [uncultured Variovorax sp.]